MNSAALDAHWREALKDKKRFSLEWYRKHPITKELLKADIFHGNVIEFGCGIGTRAFIAGAENLECHIVAVDGSDFAIDDARAHYAGVEYEKCDLLDLQYWDNIFDNGYMLAVIEHIWDTANLLSECKRVIKPGGKIFVSVTANDYHGDPSHVHKFDMVGLMTALIDNGFRVPKLYWLDHIIYATAVVA